jgi:hypothetical protein
MPGKSPARERIAPESYVFYWGKQPRKNFFARGVAIALWNSSFQTRKSKEIQTFSLEKFGWSLCWLGSILKNFAPAWKPFKRQRPQR